MTFSINQKILTVSLRARGFTLVETLVGSAIFVLIALTAYKAFGVLMTAVSSSQAKVATTSLANEKLEIIRNLPYGDVGIVTGLPAGKMQRTQNVTRDGYAFTIQTTVRNVDDPFDGTIGGNPPDTSPADYKLVDLDITCSNCQVFSPVKFTAIVAPQALETASVNGALFIQAFDAGGIPITGATVHVLNNQTNPSTVIDEITDNGGWLKIVDAPPGINAYNITLTKPGFSQDQTYPSGGAAGPNPVKPDATVVLHQVTQVSFAIDKTSSLNVSTVDATCAALPSIGFSLTGTKLIGTPSVLKYPTQNFSTNLSGAYQFSNLEWDTYSTLLTSATYDLAGTTPLPSFTLNPNENKILQMVAVPHLNRALLVSVKDSTNGAIDGATVRLQKSGFDQTKTTSSGSCVTPGQVFWNGLASGAYTLTISKTGYQTSPASVDMSPSWQNKTIILTP